MPLHCSPGTVTFHEKDDAYHGAILLGNLDGPHGIYFKIKSTDPLSQVHPNIGYLPADTSIAVRFVQKNRSTCFARLRFQVQFMTDYVDHIERPIHGWQVAEFWNEINRLGTDFDTIILRSRAHEQKDTAKPSGSKTLYSLTANIQDTPGHTVLDGTDFDGPPTETLFEMTEDKRWSSVETIPVSFHPSKAINSEGRQIKVPRQKRKQIITFHEVTAPMTHIWGSGQIHRDIPEPTYYNVESSLSSTKESEKTASKDDTAIRSQKSEVRLNVKDSEKIASKDDIAIKRQKSELRLNVKESEAKPKIFDSKMSMTCNRPSKLSFPSLSISTSGPELSGWQESHEILRSPSESSKSSGTNIIDTTDGEKFLQQFRARCVMSPKLEKIEEVPVESKLGTEKDRSFDVAIQAVKEIIAYQNPCHESTNAVLTQTPDTPSTSQTLNFAHESEKSGILKSSPSEYTNSSTTLAVQVKQASDEKFASDLEKEILHEIMKEMFSPSLVANSEPSSPSISPGTSLPRDLVDKLKWDDLVAQWLVGTPSSSRESQVASRRNAGASNYHVPMRVRTVVPKPSIELQAPPTEYYTVYSVHEGETMETVEVLNEPQPSALRLILAKVKAVVSSSMLPRARKRFIVLLAWFLMTLIAARIRH